MGHIVFKYIYISVDLEKSLHLTLQKINTPYNNLLTHITHQLNLIHKSLNFFFSDPRSDNIRMACSWRRLPEDCVSRILSATSPADACRVLAVSKEFRHPADSNVVWDKFLPADAHRIVSSTPLNFSSTKELFFLLSNSILVDAGNKAFALERSTGRKSYILSARELSISDNDVDGNWTWKSIHESRFGEVAELKGAERVEMEGKIRSEILSPNTTYAAYLVFKISDDAYGLHSIPFETFIASGERVLATNTAALRDPPLQALFYGNRLHKMKERLNRGDARAARTRHDGWLEIEVGEFFVGGAAAEITMGVMEIKGHQLKGGLIVEGIHVRPKP
ncbi:F-box protein VBF-like [Salvia miltiorrhiza]|uniref:F-box protein VBF-like n=1 Tax=Salvia miltiorrhiza TaxID=226208 RepID=UPI0025AD1503|nr:F-box protein VBF-like [Salvia miltiorrhiza]